MRYIVVIPARLKSSRFPAKPLVDINGKSMIQRTYEQCMKAVEEEKIFVATDSQEIAKHCREREMNVVLTSRTCLTGTDRVAEVAEKIPADVYINVQGDEPLIDPEDIKRVIAKAKEEPNNIINGYAKIEQEEMWLSVNVPKILMNEKRELMYISRAPVPGNKSTDFTEGWRQVCVYAFPKNCLSLFRGRNKKTKLEEIEDIEILRFLEMGVKVKMVQLTDASIAVDRPEDVEKVIKRLNES